MMYVSPELASQRACFEEAAMLLQADSLQKSAEVLLNTKEIQTLPERASGMQIESGDAASGVASGVPFAVVEPGPGS